MTLRIVFMGTPDFAVSALTALIDGGHEIAAVYCQPPRPSGRGHKTQPSPVHAYAERQGLAIRHPLSLRVPEEQEAFAALDVDIAVVAAYGLILPKPVLAAPRLGCLNVHASLLPRWRGAAPIQRAILAGDPKTGITIMQMEAGLDTGPMLLYEALEITPETTAATLHDQLAALGARMILQTLDGLVAGKLKAIPQPETGITYAAKLTREEGQIDWRQDHALIDRQIRALNPAPGVWFEYAGERIKLLSVAERLPSSSETQPGTVLDDDLLIQCGSGALRPGLLQRAGRQALDRRDFLRGLAIPRDTYLPCPATS